MDEHDPSIFNIEFADKDGKEYFYFSADRPKVFKEAFEGLSIFLKKLHIYKSMGDFEAAKKMFDHYS